MNDFPDTFLDCTEIDALYNHFDAKREQDDVPLEVFFVLRLCKQAQRYEKLNSSFAHLVRQLVDALLTIARRTGLSKGEYRTAELLFEDAIKLLQRTWREFTAQEVGVLRDVLKRAGEQSSLAAELKGTTAPPSPPSPPSPPV